MLLSSSEKKMELECSSMIEKRHFGRLIRDCPQNASGDYLRVIEPIEKIFVDPTGPRELLLSLFIPEVA